MLYPLLQSPYALGKEVLKNRLVVPPMVIWQSDCEGFVKDAHVQHYQRIAGPGLIIVEACCVVPDGRLAASQLGIYDDTYISGLAKLAQIIQKDGGLAGIQIHHAGAKTNLEKNCGKPPRVVSLHEQSPEGAKELGEEDIFAIIEAFADAAQRAVKAGFDVIEIHGAHGYLGSQFLSPVMNKRSDRWGGTLENRCRFLVETVKAVRQRIEQICPESANAPILSCRLGVADKDVPYEDGKEAAFRLIDAGVQMLHVSTAGGKPPNPEPTEDGLSAIAALGFSIRRDIDRRVPIIGVGGIKNLEQAEKALSRDEPVDLIAAGRAFLADAAWARKGFQNRSTDISSCRDCKPMCFHFYKPEACPAQKAISSGRFPAE